MTMLRPALRLTLGEQVVDTTAEPKASTAVDVVVHLDLDTPADGFIIVQGIVGGPRPAPDDDVTIALGYADTGVEVVLTGTVTDVAATPRVRRITGLSTAGRLLRHRTGETFEAKTAGQIVTDLAGRAGVATGRIDDGVDLAAYVVDNRRSVAAHIRDLATMCGHDTYTTADGALVFEAPAGDRTAHELRYGEHVLALDARRVRPRAGTVEVWGESPGASRGTESWAWLTKDFEPYRGTAGSGEPSLVVERSAIRTAAAAGVMAARTAEAIGRAVLTGTVRIQGRPRVRPGDLIRVTGVDTDDLAGNHQVRSVTHRLSKAVGFTTDIGFRSLGGPTP